MIAWGLEMDTRNGFEILRRAADAAMERRATDYMRACARQPRYVAGVADVARGLQRATDAAGAELAALGCFNGMEVELVLQAIVCGLIPPPYYFGEDDQP